MLRNYIKIAFRNLRRHRFISFINIVGLTVGLTSCLLILAYFLDELKYDKYHKNADRLYRVALDWKWKSGDVHTAITSGPIAPLLKENFPEIENTARFFTEGTEFIKTNTEPLEVTPIFTENSFFNLFTYTFIYGDANTALSEPNSIVLTESTAKKIFGDASLAAGKLVSYLNSSPQKITGIIKDVPASSHFHFDVVGVLDTQAGFMKSLQNFSIYTYVLLKKGANVEKLQAKVNAFITKEAKDPGAEIRLPLQPITSIHLHSHLANELGANGNILYLYIFFLVAGIILLLACINYINLATAQAIKRAKEVGIRKVMGSARWQLISQFFIESLLLVIGACILSLLFMELISPLLKQIAGREISIWTNGWLFVTGLMLAVALGLGILSGLYPAIFLSHFKPITVLKGVFGNSTSNTFFKKSLVVFQFTISTTLIVFTWITYRQLNYATKTDLGFTKDQVVGIRIGLDLRTRNLEAFKTQLVQNPAIAGSASTSLPLGSDYISGQGFFLETNGQKADHTNIGHFLGIDPDYLQLMQIPLLEGRNFSPSIQSDSLKAVIVNEALVKKAGWKDAIGKRVWYFTGEDGSTAEAKVIGVVKDFHMASLHKSIEPLVLYMAPKEEADNLFVKIKPAKVTAALAYIQKTFKQFDANNPLQTYFLDQNFARQYVEDERKGNLFLLFTSLAIFIACMGLFGLAAFTVEQRTKEIGIRKVLGASIQHLLFLLSKDFLLLVLIAFIIATPIAWWVSYTWLQDFAYRVDVSWWVFVISGFAALTIAFLTVGIHAFKTADANPVKSLRTE
ncbi:MAG: ABC transporter permease [Chitinophagaceae bacterium]